MNESKFAALIRFLFGEERKQVNVPAGKVKKMLSGVLKKAEDPTGEAKGRDR